MEITNPTPHFPNTVTIPQIPKIKNKPQRTYSPSYSCATPGRLAAGDDVAAVDTVVAGSGLPDASHSAAARGVRDSAADAGTSAHRGDASLGLGNSAVDDDGSAASARREAAAASGSSARCCCPGSRNP